MNLSPQVLATGIALLALVPVAVFLFAKAQIVALSIVCVLVIATSLYYMFSPPEEAHAVH